MSIYFFCTKKALPSKGGHHSKAPFYPLTHPGADAVISTMRRYSLVKGISMRIMSLR